MASEFENPRPGAEVVLQAICAELAKRLGPEIRGRSLDGKPASRPLLTVRFALIPGRSAYQLQVGDEMVVLSIDELRGTNPKRLIDMVVSRVELARAIREQRGGDEISALTARVNEADRRRREEEIDGLKRVMDKGFSGGDAFKVDFMLAAPPVASAYRELIRSRDLIGSWAGAWDREPPRQVVMGGRGGKVAASDALKEFAGKIRPAPPVAPPVAQKRAPAAKAAAVQAKGLIEQDDTRKFFLD